MVAVLHNKGASMKTNVIHSALSESLQTAGFLRLRDVLKIIPVSKSHWWAGCKNGKYPKPYKLGPRITAWRAKDIISCAEKLWRMDDAL